jgi:hypothetical protein
MKTQTTIRNCDRSFRFVCPQKWGDLARTDVDSQRFCDKCEQIVYLCVSDAETLEHARAGHCIARETPDASELPAVYVGRPKEPILETESQVQARAWAHREHGIDDSLRNIDADRTCPECGFPAPDWREACRVCGNVFGRVVRHADAP